MCGASGAMPPVPDHLDMPDTRQHRYVVIDVSNSQWDRLARERLARLEVDLELRQLWANLLDETSVDLKKRVLQMAHTTQ
jgi:hypothetical protein